LILKTKDLKENPNYIIKQICDFLNIDLPKAVTNNKQLNKAAVPKNKTIQNFLLNRNNPVRKIIRNIVPRKIKDSIINSGVVDKLHKLNKKELEYSPLSDEMRIIAGKYFENDLTLLKQDYNISFD
jgi:hypothetical protein